jgi:hypothetical protein
MKKETIFRQAEMKFTISVIEENLEAAVHAVWDMAKQENGLPINYGSVTQVQGANLRENGMRSSKSGDAQRTCRNETI